MTVSELYEKLNSAEFQDTRNGDMFYNFFIYQYDAKDEYKMRSEIKMFKDNLIRPSSYIDVLTLDLFEEFCKFLDGKAFGNNNPSMLKFIMNFEQSKPDNAKKIIESQANSKEFFEFLHNRIIEHISKDDDVYKRPYVFVYGVGDMFPYLRTSDFLNKYEQFNKTSRYKIIVFYPGHRAENSFTLFDILDESHTYRATFLVNANNE